MAEQLMRIALVVTGGLDRSGRERVIPSLLALVERLASQHAVTVYVLRYHEVACTYQLLGATVCDLGRPEGVVAQYRALRAALRRDGPFDVVHGYWVLPAGLAACAAARRLGIPSVLTLDSGELVALDDIGYGLQRTLRHRLSVRAAAALASRVTVCSDYMRRLAAAHHIPVVQIPIGVDSRRFLPAGSAPADAPPWRLLHVASLNTVKDQRTLLEALAIVISHIPQVTLDVVGDDTLGGAIQRAAAELGVAGHVTFHGFQPSDALVRFYQRAHLHVLPSRHEAAGVVTLEAAASGVPTVGSAVGYVADWMPGGATGVPPQNPAALARAIVALLEDPHRRAKLAGAARRWTAAHDADWTAGRFTQLYREVTGR